MFYRSFQILQFRNKYLKLRTIKKKETRKKRKRDENFWAWRIKIKSLMKDETRFFFFYFQILFGGAKTKKKVVEEETTDLVHIRELRFQGNAEGDVISRWTRPESFLYPIRARGRKACERFLKPFSSGARTTPKETAAELEERVERTEESVDFGSLLRLYKARFLTMPIVKRSYERIFEKFDPVEYFIYFEMIRFLTRRFIICSHYLLPRSTSVR